jgi:cation:H+ antiporter
LGLTTLQVSGALALLFAGADLLVRGASALALRLGVSALAVGLTVVAFGTSAPELVVSLGAALSGANDIAIGNVVGSNVANVALILGVAVLIRPITSHAKIVRVDAPLMVLVSLLLLALLANGVLSRFEGLLLMLGLGAFVMATFRQARTEARTVKAEFAAVAPPRRASILVSSILVLIGLSLLVAGGHLLVAGAVQLATGLGVSEAVIGLTIVAVGTSLPELATSAVASFRGHGDIAIGNVVGSNIFNVLGILGVTATAHPLELGNVSWLDLGLMVALAVVLIPLLVTRSRLDRWEGAVLLAVFALNTAYLLAA